MNTRILAAAALAATLLPGATAAQAAGKCGLVDIMEIIAIQPSSGTDSGVNEALTGMASAWASAQGESNKETGETLASMEDPKIAALGAVVMASGGSLAAMAAAFTALPGVITAIDDSRDDADDLYIGFNSERGDDGAFWPAPNDYSDVAIRGAPVAMPGREGLVPFVLGLTKDMEKVSINLFDHDSGSRDDHLGSVTFSVGDIGKGPQKTLMINDKHGGVVYGFEYQVVEVPCDFGGVALVRADQRLERNTEEGSERAVLNFNIHAFPFLIPHLIGTDIL